jgi:hypothetical protein
METFLFSMQSYWLHVLDRASMGAGLCRCAEGWPTEGSAARRETHGSQARLLIHVSLAISGVAGLLLEHDTSLPHYCGDDNGIDGP